MLLLPKRRLFHFRKSLAFASAWCLALITPVARAQCSSNSISGVVKDQSGAVVQKAEVTGKAGKYRATKLTSDGGEFRFENVPAGQATLRVRAANFRELQSELVLPPPEPLTITLLAAADPVEIVVTASRSPEEE